MAWALMGLPHQRSQQEPGWAWVRTQPAAADRSSSRVASDSGDASSSASGDERDSAVAANATAQFVAQSLQQLDKEEGTAEGGDAALASVAQSSDAAARLSRAGVGAPL